MSYERKYQYLYNAKWTRMSKAFIRGKLCVYCLQMGKSKAAELTDHQVPHEGDVELFWDEKNWQPLCRACHDSVKRQEEARGYAVGCDVDGLPIDKNHPWHNKNGK